MTRHALAFALAAVLPLLLLGAAPASATPPGLNGPIVFVSDDDGDQEIFLIKGSGRTQTNVQLTDNTGIDTDPAWSPTLTSIAFASNFPSRGNPEGDFEIFTIKPGGGGLKQLTHNSSDDRAPTWSPDGETLAFSSNRDGDEEIFFMGKDGSEQEQLTDNSTSDGEPSWSPDGKRIAFTSNRDGDREIFVMQPDGTGETALTFNASEDFEPSWSPDGKRIAFTSNRDGDDDIFALELGGRRGTTQLTETAAEDREPSWSPDGRKIAFSSDRLGAFRIFVLDAVGPAHDQTQLVNTLQTLRQPDWGRLLNITFGPQAARNVIVVRHGNFMIVEFDQRYSADKPRVELWRNGVVRFQFGLGPPAQHWKIQINYLKPETKYNLRIVMNDPNGEKQTYKHKEPVRTLAREVTITARWVKVHDDSDELSCGEFEFDFTILGNSFGHYVRLPPGLDFHDICDNEAWDPKNVSESFEHVKGDTITVEVIGVDNDQGLLDIPLSCQKYGGCKSLGNWAENSRNLSVAPEDFTVAGEEFKHFTDIYAKHADGPSFTFHFAYSVSYVTP